MRHGKNNQRKWDDYVRLTIYVEPTIISNLTEGHFDSSRFKIAISTKLVSRLFILIIFEF